MEWTQAAASPSAAITVYDMLQTPMKLDLTNTSLSLIDNFLDDIDYNKIIDKSSGYLFKSNHKSNISTDPHGHWVFNLVNDDLQNDSTSTLNVVNYIKDDFYKDIWKFIQKKYELEDKILIRYYMNAYTYGTEGYAHTDSNRNDEWTLILYVLNDFWNIDWAGETVLFNNNEVIQSILPKKNRAFIFPSKMKHAARSVSRICYQTRKTLVFKFRNLFTEEI